MLILVNQVPHTHTHTHTHTHHLCYQDEKNFLTTDAGLSATGYRLDLLTPSARKGRREKYVSYWWKFRNHIKKTDYLVLFFSSKRWHEGKKSKLWGAKVEKTFFTVPDKRCDAKTVSCVYVCSYVSPLKSDRWKDWRHQMLAKKGRKNLSSSRCNGCWRTSCWKMGACACLFRVFSEWIAWVAWWQNAVLFPMTGLFLFCSKKFFLDHFSITGYRMLDVTNPFS